MDTLYTAAACRELDQIAINEQGVPGFALMQRAGEAAFASLLEHWSGLRSVTICCGRGNNAGDGYVVAALARRFGIAVELLQVGAADALVGDAARARDLALAAGVEVLTDWPAKPAGEVIVDALLGTGLRLPLRTDYAAAVSWINAAGRPVLALDLPTGVHPDTGAVGDPVIRAAVTVMFIGRKLGLYTGPGVACAGVREWADLGVDHGILERVQGYPLLDYDRLEAACRLPARDADAHKHSFGHVVIVGGDRSMGGAPLMAAEAALRVGAGLVSVVTRAAHRPALLARRPELMVVDADEAFERAAVLARATCLVVGPGLGREPWGQALLREACALGRPMVVDADGLRGIAELGLRATGPLIVTPHPGEAAALLNTSAAAIQGDRPAAARALAHQLGSVVVLKGAGTLVADADGRLLGVCSHGNPGMASAGMGDVLAGVIGGLLGQGLAPVAAAQAGTCLHSLAADHAVRQRGERSLLATDLIEPIIAILAAESGHRPSGSRGRAR